MISAALSSVAGLGPLVVRGWRWAWQHRATIGVALLVGACVAGVVGLWARGTIEHGLRVAAEAERDAVQTRADTLEARYERELAEALAANDTLWAYTDHLRELFDEAARRAELAVAERRAAEARIAEAYDAARSADEQRVEAEITATECADVWAQLLEVLGLTDGGGP